MREFTINDPLFKIRLKCPDKCCLFCQHCTDYFYDYHGPYLFICDVEGDTEEASHGNCKLFEELAVMKGGAE